MIRVRVSGESTSVTIRGRLPYRELRVGGKERAARSVRWSARIQGHSIVQCVHGCRNLGQQRLKNHQQSVHEHSRQQHGTREQIGIPFA